MRRALLIASAVLLPAALFAQMVGMTTEETRQLIITSEMGHSLPKGEKPGRPLTFEEADDPTVAAHPLPPHVPPAAARKAARKAEHLAKKKHHVEAIAKYREAVADDPQYFEAWNNLALELNTIGKTDEAIAALRHAVQYAPQHVVGFANLAELLCQQKRYAEAETVARQAMKLHKHSFDANFTLGIILVDEGKFTWEAKGDLEYAEVRYPRAKSLLASWPVNKPAK